MTIDDAIAEDSKRVVDDVVALGGFGLMEKTASKPFDIDLRFKVRAVRKAFSQLQAFISGFLLRSKIEYQMAAAWQNTSLATISSILHQWRPFLDPCHRMTSC